MKIRKLIRNITLVVLLLLFLPFFINLGLLLELPAGWIRFLARVIPEITLNWSIVGMFALCLVLILGGVQYFCSWLYIHAQRVSDSGALVRNWSWRWTGSIVAGTCLLFFIGMAVIGVVHQTVWLLTSTDSMYVRRYGGSDFFLGMRQEDANMEMALGAAGTNTFASFDGFRKTVLEQDFDNWHEKLQTLVIVDAQGNPIGWIIFPRDPQRRAHLRALITTQETNDFLAAEKLPGIISKYSPSLKSL